MPTRDLSKMSLESDIVRASTTLDMSPVAITYSVRARSPTSVLCPVTANDLTRVNFELRDLTSNRGFLTVLKKHSRSL